MLIEQYTLAMPWCSLDLRRIIFMQLAMFWVFWYVLWILLKIAGDLCSLVFCCICTIDEIIVVASVHDSATIS